MNQGSSHPGPDITLDELQLATRNHGMPLEALRWEITPLGLHYLLIHYDIPFVDAATWTLSIGGCVRRPLTLRLGGLRARDARTLAVTMECAGNGRARLAPRPLSQPWLHEAVGTAEWTGVPLAAVLDEARPGDGAKEIVFTGLDRGIEGGVVQDYERSLPLDEARRDDVLLAYEMNGVALLPQHGFPLRLVVPGWYGMASVKWLTSITVIEDDFTGYQQSEGYRLLSSPEDPGTPVTRIMPRALMVPPGIPDFVTRRRLWEGGPCPIMGRAWSGFGPIVAVDMSADGGATWNRAEIRADSPSAHAWSSWAWTWQPPGPGDYELCCRARDAAGNEQPVASPWNVKGYENNAVQRVHVTVLDH